LGGKTGLWEYTTLFVKNARPKDHLPGITKTRNGKKKMSAEIISTTGSSQDDMFWNIFRPIPVLPVVNLIPCS
jgi:hypothetical protein